MRLKKREIIEKPDIVYDLEVKDDHNYIVEGAVVHNCHRAKAVELSKIMKKLHSAVYRIGTTGTVPKEEADRRTIVGSLGPVQKIISGSELIDKDIASPIKIISCVLRYGKDKIKEYNPSRTKTINKVKIKIPGEEVFRKEKEVLRLPERLEFITKLICSLNGNAMVLAENYDLIDALIEAVNENCPDKEVFVMTGKIKKEKREEIRQAVSRADGNAVIIATYGVASTGISIPSLHNIVLASPTKSFTRFIQTLGRGMRKAEGKEQCLVFDIVDDLRRISKAGKEYPNYFYSHWAERVSHSADQNYETIVKPVKLDPLG